MNCKHCNEETELFRGKPKVFCSLKCHDDYYDRPPKLVLLPMPCEQCGQIFNPSNRTQRHCCKTCYSRSKTIANSPKPKQCKYCGKDFKPYSSLDRYCSAKCRIDNFKSKHRFQWTPEQVAKRVGEKNPAYRNGFYTRTTKKTAIGMRKFQINRKGILDGMKETRGYIFCQHCDTSNSPRFEAHHLIYRSEKPGHENLNDSANIIILCIGCHNEFHKHKSIRNYIVAERGLDLIFGKDVLNK